MRGCFWRHHWGSWEVVAEGSLSSGEVAANGEEARIGEYTRQKRVCIRCGYQQIDIQRVYYDPVDEARNRRLAHEG